MKVQHLFEKTMLSRPPAELEALFKRLAYKHLYTRAEYELSKNVMGFDEWQLARLERDFDIQVKDTDPRRIAIDLRGLIDLAIKLDITRLNYSRRDQVDDLKGWITKLIKPLGWFVFRVTKTYLQLDPMIQEAIKVPSKVYHFSLARNKDSILKKGILPRQGQYNDDYMYPPRVHVLLRHDESEIYDLAMNVLNWGLDSEDVYHGGAEHAPLVIFEIDTAKLNKGTRFYEDISVHNGAWTYTHIPPQAIRVIHED